MNFHEVRFPAPLSIGSSGGPERRTEIVTLSNGFEERNTPWRYSRRRYDAGLGLRSLDDLAEVTAFFEARAGQLVGFRWKDWADFKSCAPSGVPGARDQRIGVGDAETRVFQLTKAYASGGHDYARPISKPVALSVRIAVADEEFAEGVDFEVDSTTGVVRLAEAPMVGAFVSAGFEFDVPVRFDADRIAVSVAGFMAGEIPAIPVVELRV